MSSLIEWVTIPSGPVMLEVNGDRQNVTRYEVAAFAIARYPLTNAVFAHFIEAGGYANQTWWDAAGWKLKQRERWEEPRFWDNLEWNKADYPVVGVSWYEAVAFCRWLSESSGETISLPSEQQWQRAAQGDDGREFPWGNAEPDDTLCNWQRAVDQTTPVTAYPAGASPFGVLDLSGNVWEWCLTADNQAAAQGKDLRLLRGGSWSSDSPISLRAAHRSAIDPNTRLEAKYRNHVTVGFRVSKLS